MNNCSIILPTPVQYIDTCTVSSFFYQINTIILFQSANIIIALIDNSNNAINRFQYCLEGDEYTNWKDDDNYVINLITSKIPIFLTTLPYIDPINMVNSQMIPYFTANYNLVNLEIPIICTNTYNIVSYNYKFTNTILAVSANVLMYLIDDTGSQRTIISYLVEGTEYANWGGNDTYMIDLLNRTIYTLINV